MDSILEDLAAIVIDDDVPIQGRYIDNVEGVIGEPATGIIICTIVGHASDSASDFTTVLTRTSTSRDVADLAGAASTIHVSRTIPNGLSQRNPGLVPKAIAFAEEQLNDVANATPDDLISLNGEAVPCRMWTFAGATSAISAAPWAFTVFANTGPGWLRKVRFASISDLSSLGVEGGRYDMQKSSALRERLSDSRPQQTSLHVDYQSLP